MGKWSWHQEPWLGETGTASCSQSRKVICGYWYANELTHYSEWKGSVVPSYTIHLSCIIAWQRGSAFPGLGVGNTNKPMGPSLQVLWWAPTHLGFSWGLRSFRMWLSWLVTLPKSWIPWCWQIQAHSFYRLLVVPACRSSAYSPVFRATFSLLDLRPLQSTPNWVRLPWTNPIWLTWSHLTLPDVPAPSREAW